MEGLTEEQKAVFSGLEAFQNSSLFKAGAVETRFPCCLEGKPKLLELEDRSRYRMTWYFLCESCGLRVNSRFTGEIGDKYARSYKYRLKDIAHEIGRDWLQITNRRRATTYLKYLTELNNEFDVIGFSIKNTLFEVRFSDKFLANMGHPRGDIFYSNLRQDENLCYIGHLDFVTKASLHYAKSEKQREYLIRLIILNGHYGISSFSFAKNGAYNFKINFRNDYLWLYGNQDLPEPDPIVFNCVT